MEDWGSGLPLGSSRFPLRQSLPQNPKFTSWLDWYVIELQGSTRFQPHRTPSNRVTGVRYHTWHLHECSVTRIGSQVFTLIEQALYQLSPSLQPYFPICVHWFHAFSIFTCYVEILNNFSSFKIHFFSLVLRTELYIPQLIFDIFLCRWIKTSQRYQHPNPQFVRKCCVSTRRTFIYRIEPRTRRLAIQYYKDAEEGNLTAVGDIVRAGDGRTGHRGKHVCGF